MCYNLAVEATRQRFRDELGWDPGEGWRGQERLNGFSHPHLPLMLGETSGGGWTLASWGLVPPWSTQDGQPQRRGTLNARWETAPTKPSFRDAYRRGRAVIPVTGFWEWTPAEGGRKALVKVHTGGEWLFLAALATYWEARGEWTLAVITLDAAGQLKALHSRMPLALTPEGRRAWLAKELPSRSSLEQEARQLCQGWTITRSLRGSPDGWPGDLLGSPDG